MRARLAVSLRGVSLRRGDHWVLRDITCSLRPGERWALLGDNGAGKTQFLKLLSGDIWPTPPTRPGLMYRLGKRPIELLEAKPRMAYIGAERQDKYARYGWNLSVRDVVATGLHQSDLLLKPLTRGEMQRVRGTLGECGIAALAKREFLSLSYGEKRLTLLGRSLVRNPDWLLLDEFYNGLDASYRRRIDAVLERARRHGQSWVATTHRAIDVPRGTRSLIELREGRIHAVKKLRREDSRRLVSRAGERSREARAVSRPNSVARCGDAARRAPVLIRILHADLYVEYRLVLKSPELAIAWRRALVDIRRQRGGEIQLSEVAIRRFGARARRTNRTPRLPPGDAHVAVEKTRRLCLSRAAEHLRGRGQHSGAGGQRPAREHRTQRAADTSRSMRCAALAEVLPAHSNAAARPARAVVRAAAPRLGGARDGCKPSPSAPR